MGVIALRTSTRVHRHISLRPPFHRTVRRSCPGRSLEQRHRLTRATSNRYPDGPIQDQLQTSAQVESTAKDFLSSCPTDRYLVVLQPNLSPDELRGANSQSAPNLRQASAHENVATRLSVASVVGEVSISEITWAIDDACAKAGRTHQLEEMKLPALPYSNSASRLADNGWSSTTSDEILRSSGELTVALDYVLGESLREVQAGDSYTIVYLTTPAEAPRLRTAPVQTELKRGVSALFARQNGTERDTRSLFEKYQFFNEGMSRLVFCTGHC